MAGLLDKIEEIGGQAPARIKQSECMDSLEEIRLEYLGRKGLLTSILHGVKDASAQERPLIGKQANLLKNKLAGLIDQRRQELEQHRTQSELASGRIDVTLPGSRPWTGSIHPLNQVLERINEIFFGMGFALAEGPEVEDEFHNFDALNTPEDHPARAEQDTMYLEGGMLLRSHTSPVQIRHMLSHQPPVRIIAPGRVFRRDTPDATHSPVFHQVEGLYVDKNVTFGDLRYTLEQFAMQMFGSGAKLRFRPSFFPFTEPSAEVDISCIFCDGKGCKVCKQVGWIELLGCGMVDPNVFDSVGYDNERYTGFAFGMGIDRICMTFNGVNDIRLFLESDVAFLSQF